MRRIDNQRDHNNRDNQSVFMAQRNSVDHSAPGSESETGVELASRIETPKMYRVLLLNDDYTPMEFVVLVLQRFFGKNQEEANLIMLDVHKKGSGTAGIFTLEMAEMKVMQVNQFARMNQHPLKSVLEPE